MPEALPALVVFAFAATASPGGATALATASGARFGYRRSLPLILGVATALACLVALSGTGLSAALRNAPLLEWGIRTVGSAYLLWLAIRIGTAGAPSSRSLNGARPIGFFGAGALLLVNPKAWAMAVGVASSFSDLAAAPLRVGGTLAAVFLLAAGLSMSIWTLAGRLLAARLSRDWHWHLFNGVMAALLAVTVLQFWL
ncbi:MAG: LysE family translocator [Pseudomonadota bacterium]